MNSKLEKDFLILDSSYKKVIHSDYDIYYLIDWSDSATTVNGNNFRAHVKLLKQKAVSFMGEENLNIYLNSSLD